MIIKLGKILDDCNKFGYIEKGNYHLDEPQGYFSFYTIQHLIEYYQELMK